MPQRITKLPLKRGVDFLRYCPHSAQMRFHAGRQIYSQRSCLCGTGSGKTKAGLHEDLITALDYPGSVGYIFEPSYPMINRIIFPTLESPDFLGCSYPFIENPEVKNFSRENLCLEFKNGSQWWFVSLDDSERAEGPNIDYAHIDEARLVRHLSGAWLTIMRRLRGSKRCRVKFDPSVWITTTTDHPGSDLYNIVENPQTASRKNMKVYRWSVYDNTTLSAKFIEEIVRLHPGGLRDRFIYGRFAAVASGTLPFDTSRHVKELLPENVVYIRYGVDFGWAAPSAIMANAFDPLGEGYLVDEFYKTETTDEELLEAAVEMEDHWGKGTFYCDARFPQSIMKMRRGHVKGDGSRIRGINAVPYTFKREDGLREFGSRLVGSGGRPRQYVSKRCVNFISEALEYREDVKERDHAIDAARYSLPLTPTSPVTARRAVIR